MDPGNKPKKSGRKRHRGKTKTQGDPGNVDSAAGRNTTEIASNADTATVTKPVQHAENKNATTATIDRPKLSPAQDVQAVTDAAKTDGVGPSTVKEKGKNLVPLDISRTPEKKTSPGKKKTEEQNNTVESVKESTQPAVGSDKLNAEVDVSASQTAQLAAKANDIVLKSDNPPPLENTSIIITATASVVVATPEVIQTGETAQPIEEGKTKAQLKAERRATFEAQRAAREQEDARKETVTTSEAVIKANSSAPGSDSTQNQEEGKTKAQLKSERRAIQEAQRAAKGQQNTSGKETNDKSKASLKADRRAVQEAQRAAKANKKTDGTPITPPVKPVIRAPPTIQADDPSVEKKLAKKLATQKIPQRTVAQRKIRLFNHLHQYEREVSLTQNMPLSGGNLHPAIIALGLQYAEGVICGSNARCLALVYALKQVIQDYVTPPQKELARDLEAKLKPYISFLQQCRPLSVSMGNTIKHVKMLITNTPPEQPEMQAKQHLLECLDNFVTNNIFKAHEAISLHARSKLTNGDVILTYGHSSSVLRVLKDAKKENLQFRVIVVDGRPKLEGKVMLQELVKAGVHCSYSLIGAVSHLMPEVSKVVIGAHALLANGYVMSRIGTSQVALIAKAFNKPVLLCCETYKFSERVQTDSFVFNELGDPDDLILSSTTRQQKGDLPLSDWRDMKTLTLLNLTYDVTTSDLITVVITDIGMIPCTSVPVVLRVKHTDQ